MTFATFMQAGGWALYCLAAALFSAGFSLTNQYYNIPGFKLVFWMRLITVAAMTPVMFFVDWPSAPAFYIVILLTAIFGVAADVRAVNVAAQYGGGVMARVIPMTVWAAFLLWIVINPADLDHYRQDPLRSLGIVMALLGCVYFAARLQKCDITRPAIRAMLPALFGYTVTTVLSKLAMRSGAVASSGSESFTGAVYCYMYVQSLFAVIGLVPYLALRARQAGHEKRAEVFLLSPVMAKGALILAFAWSMHMLFRNYAIAYIMNPAYQTALNLTAPVMISLYYKLTGHHERADARAGFGIVVSALVLALLAL